MLLPLLLPTLLSLAPTPARPVVVGAHAIAGAVVFDLDRGEQWTVSLDDDGHAVATAIDRGRAREHRGAQGPTLPRTIEHIDVTADGAAVVVRGDGRAVRVSLTR